MRLNAYRGLTKTMETGIPGPEGSLGKWQWADINQEHHRAGARDRGRLRAARPRRRTRRRRRRLAVRLPALPRQLDRGRDHRHPQEHHRRAGARPSEAALAATVYFDLNDEQSAIKETARDFLAARYKPASGSASWPSRDHGFDDSDWKEMAELGWTGLALPEEWGGQGLGIVDLAVLFEELGYALAPSPLFSNTIRRPRAGGAAGRRAEGALPAAARRGRGPRHPRPSSTPAPRPAIGHFEMEAQRRRRRHRPRRREDAGHGRRRSRLLPRRHRRRRRHVVERDAEGVTVEPEPSIDPTRTPLHGPLRRRARRRRGHASRPSARTTCRSFTAAASRSPPSRPGSPSARWRWPSTTPRTGSSSAARSAPTRPSPTAAPRCCWRPRTPARRVSTRPGPPTPSRSRCRSPPRWRRPTPPTPAGGSPTPAIQVHGGIGFTWEHDLHFFLKRATGERGDVRRRQVAPRAGRRRVLAAVGEPASPAAGLHSTALERISVAAIGTSVADLEAETLKRRGGRGRVRLGAGAVPQLGHPGGLPRRPHRDRSASRPESPGRSPAARSSSPSPRSTSTRCRAGASASGSAPASSASTRPGTTSTTASPRRTCARRSRRRG